MKIIFDASVIVASVVKAHPAHDLAFPWLKRARSGEFDLLVSCHTLAETYAVLSSLPMSPRISPILAWRLVNENIEAAAKLIALSAADYSNVIRRMGERGLSDWTFNSEGDRSSSREAAGIQTLHIGPAIVLILPGKSHRLGWNSMREGQMIWDNRSQRMHAGCVGFFDIQYVPLIQDDPVS